MFHSSNKNGSKKLVTKGIRISLERIKFLSYDPKMNSMPKREIPFQKYKENHREIIQRRKYIQCQFLYYYSKTKTKNNNQPFSNVLFQFSASMIQQNISKIIS